MKTPLYRGLGLLCLAFAVGATLLPLLPTTPFVIAAAYLFARSHPEWERRLLAHPVLGPAIRHWTDHGAIPVPAKWAATGLLAISIVTGFAMLTGHWRFVPTACAAAVLVWIWTRPSA